MSALRMHAITGILGAALAGGVASLAPFAFMDAMAPWPASHAALAGGAYGCLASIMLGGGRSALGASVSRALALANPLILVCLAAPGAALALIAAFILWRGVFALAAFADHRGAVGMALALVAAPIVSPLALGAYPALVPALAALSPWRPGARRLAGFYFVVLAPAAMLLAGAGYFAWLYSLPVMALAPPQPEWDAIAFRKFVPLLAGGAALAGRRHLSGDRCRLRGRRRRARRSVRAGGGRDGGGADSLGDMRAPPAPGAFLRSRGRRTSPRAWVMKRNP
jgi:hypothetical protein